MWGRRSCEPLCSGGRGDSSLGPQQLGPGMLRGSSLFFPEEITSFTSTEGNSRPCSTSGLVLCSPGEHR